MWEKEKWTISQLQGTSEKTEFCRETKKRKSQLKEEDKHWCYNFFNWELNTKYNHYTFIENIWLNKVMLMFKSKGATSYENREH